jgi:hypothetical protein
MFLARALAIAAALLALPGLARAQDAAARDEARALVRQAAELAQRGQHADALEKLKAAYGRFPSPKILLNMGTTLRGLGREAEAANAYERYLGESGPEVTAAKRAEVTGILAEIAPRLGRLVIEVNEADAEVRANGDSIGRSPLPLSYWVFPGRHQAQATKPGFSMVSESAEVAAGATHTFKLVLPRETVEEQARHGVVPTPPAGGGPSAGGPSAGGPTAGGPAAGGPAAGGPAAGGPGISRGPGPALRPLTGHRRQFGVLVRGDADTEFKGGVAVVGLTYGILDWLEVAAAALLGFDQGLRVWAQFYVLPAKPYKPFFTVGMPMFFRGGVSPGVHAGAGFQYDFNRHVGLLAELAMEFYPSVPAERAVGPGDNMALLFVPSIGVQARF